MTRFLPAFFRSGTPARTSLALLSAAAVLSACGGDDSVQPTATPAQGATPVAPPATTTPCVPDQATFDGLLIGDTRARVEQIIGCPGVQPDRELVTAEYTQLQWLDAGNDERFVELRFVKDRLFQKQARRLDTALGPSACIPTAAAFSQVREGMNLAAVVALVGCDGRQYFTLEWDGYRETSWLWGSLAAGAPAATVKISAGVVSSTQARGLK